MFDEEEFMFRDNTIDQSHDEDGAQIAAEMREEIYAQIDVLQRGLGSYAMGGE